MAENTEAEPSIEEILDSIRQIISDDDEEEAGPSAEPEPEEEVIELRNKVEEEPEPEPEPIEVDMTETELPPPPRRDPPKPKPAPRREPEQDFDSILTSVAETAAYEGFSELARRTAVEEGGGITLEEIVRGELKPLLRGWLDKHLPPIIERLVQEELERVAKRAMED
jgi:cell pole-organizing protein PopZ